MLKGDAKQLFILSELRMESTSEGFNDCRKALFTSPGVNMNDKSDQTEKTVHSMLQIEQETDQAFKNSQKDAHDKRMKQFRQMAKHLSEDDWMYPSIEKLIGLK